MTPIKTLQKAVEEGRYKVNFKYLYKEALDLYNSKKYKNLRKDFDPFANKLLRKIDGTIDVDRWSLMVKNLCRQNEYNTKIRFYKNILNETDGEKVIYECDDYFIIGFYSQQRLYRFINNNRVWGRLDKESVKTTSKGHDVYMFHIRDNKTTPPSKYVKEIGDYDFYMIPSWCIGVDDDGGFWQSYALDKGTKCQCFVFVSKLHANWRFALVYSSNGTLKEVRDPWQVSQDANRIYGGVQKLIAAHGQEAFENTLKVIREFRKNDTSSKKAIYNCTLNKLWNSRRRSNECKLYSFVLFKNIYSWLYSRDINKVRKALEYGLDINYKTQSWNSRCRIYLDFGYNYTYEREKVPVRPTHTPLENAITNYIKRGRYSLEIIDFFFKKANPNPASLEILMHRIGSNLRYEEIRCEYMCMSKEFRLGVERYRKRYDEIVDTFFSSMKNRIEDKIKTDEIELLTSVISTAKSQMWYWGGNNHKNLPLKELRLAYTKVDKIKEGNWYVDYELCGGGNSIKSK